MHTKNRNSTDFNVAFSMTCEPFDVKFVLSLHGSRLQLKPKINGQAIHIVHNLQ